MIDLHAFFLFTGHLPEVAASVFSKIAGRRDTILALPPRRYWQCGRGACGTRAADQDY